ncbi:exodeoxyribonuclease III [Roseateles depolymerans]|uniref:Exodeoxyribonuclease III n=1 Tax=Roseateles depolymerans TaxID=76731 RepID=A0A0U3CDQ9_9BURK|nr:exodeoxyribonuclease III [Roseateles depolymerans]ALV06856.1 Exodeoxyribonuclease III [Roseateles depolymerans]REG19834.1 exodeoxyribonuclease III [Roseateles depolymerans]
MKLATWNVNSLAVRLPQLLDWLAANPVDAIVLQETKLTDDKFPAKEIQDAGYQVQWFGQKTYNGVALISKEPATDIARNILGYADEQARVISGTVAGVRVIGAYFPNGQAPDSEKFVYKMAWLDGLRAQVKEELKTHPNLVLMGDFNIAPEDRDVYDPVAWAGQIHCTPQEREHFQQLLAAGLVDAFRLFEQPPKSWSWWDYRNLAFRKNQGLRIDHILVSEALKPRVTACVIDKAPRKNERPSDHAPVIVTLDTAA